MWVSLSQSQDTACVTYKVNYSGQTSCVSSYFCCRVGPEGLSYDVEHELLVIAKFLIVCTNGFFIG